MARYVERLESLYDSHKILQYVRTIAQALVKEREKTMIYNKRLYALFDKFDKLREEQVYYMISTENHTGQPPPNGIYESSTLLEEADQTIIYWKLRL